MIGVDSNVLLRLFVADDASQHAAAKAFFGARTSDDAAYLSLVAIAEFMWLVDRAYRYPLAAQFELLTIILASSNVVVENRRALELACNDAATRRCGLADALIARLADSAGCAATVTFDKPAAKRVPGMELLK